MRQYTYVSQCCACISGGFINSQKKDKDCSKHWNMNFKINILLCSLEETEEQFPLKEDLNR